MLIIVLDTCLGDPRSYRRDSGFNNLNRSPERPPPIPPRSESTFLAIQQNIPAAKETVPVDGSHSGSGDREGSASPAPEGGPPAGDSTREDEFLDDNLQKLVIIVRSSLPDSWPKYILYCIEQDKLTELREHMNLFYKLDLSRFSDQEILERLDIGTNLSVHSDREVDASRQSNILGSSANNESVESSEVTGGDGRGVRSEGPNQYYF